MTIAESSGVVIDYTNYRGERAERLVVPTANPARFDVTEWHPGHQWLMEAWDVAKGEYRTFAMKDIHSWRPATEADYAKVGRYTAPAG